MTGGGLVGAAPQDASVLTYWWGLAIGAALVRDLHGSRAGLVAQEMADWPERSPSCS